MAVELRRGDVFAQRFEVEREAASGGMGTIYRARDQLSGEMVALKLLSIEKGDGHEHERFARESELLAELRHSGIVSYVAHGRTPQGQRFLAMQWLDGEDLAQRLARGPLSVGEAIGLTRRVAEALDFAHKHGVVHRDLKPTNLFLCGGDIERVKILDFGVARRLATSRAITRTGILIGTPEYMAPEQARGGRDITEAADVFALGCILYECLAGEPPFVGDHLAAVLTRILFEDPIPVVERRPGLPDAVGQVLSRMLVKDPRKRIADASEVAACLAAIEELPSLPLLPTIPVPASKKTPAATPQGEQSLLSLVVAHAPSGPESTPTLLSADGSADHRSLVMELRSLGAEADLLVGGALVVTGPQLHSAKDQAMHSARMAIMIQDQWPQARIAVVTGRGSRSQGLITGEVLDRAWTLLRRTPTPSASTERRRILMDTVSAELLETRFELRPITGGFSLESERNADDATRLLLGHPTPCVGRERELGMLDGVLTECEGESVARAVVVLAPPGLGKSRLRHEFMRRLAERERQPLVLLGRGDPMKVRSSYGLLGAALRQHCQVREGDPSTEQQARLRQEVERCVRAEDRQRVTEFLGELCGTPFPDANRPQLRAARQDPRIMSDQVEQAWLDWLRGAMRAQLVLLVLEDVHYADALTMKLCQSALRTLSEQPLMVLALARPEVLDLYPNVFTGAVQQIVLQPLPRRAGERLVRQILGSDTPPSTVTRLIEQSTGNPLFLEELIRATAQRKTGEIPETVSAMLQARIGRLPARERKTLRAASVFGETFWENGVRRMLGETEASRPQDLALAELVKEEIVEEKRERRFPAEPEYRFRQGLLHDAAYGLLTDQETIDWHRAAAEFLESVSERDAAVLAEHFRLGQENKRAAAYYVKAAEQAFEAHDNDAAQSCADRGLDCGADGADRGALLSIGITTCFWRGQLQQVLALGPSALALTPAGGLAWCRTMDAFFSSALITAQISLLPELMQKVLSTEPDAEARPAYARALVWPSIFLYILGQKEPAETLIERIRQICKPLDAQDETWAYLYGAEANRTEQGVKLPWTNVRFNRDGRELAITAGNRRLQCLATTYYGKALHDLGETKKAEEILRANLALAQQLGDELPIAYSKTYLARLLASRSDAAAQEEAEALAREILGTQNPTVLGLAHGVLATTALHRRDLAIAEQEARAACEILEPFPPYRLDMVALWSRILTMMGRSADALRICEEMVQRIEALGMLSYGLVDLYVALAEARKRSGDEEGARSMLGRAVAELRRRVEDIPDADAIAIYLREVPENARLLELAGEWHVDTARLTAQ
jgi:serine/threonine protein kinase